MCRHVYTELATNWIPLFVTRKAEFYDNRPLMFEHRGAIMSIPPSHHTLTTYNFCRPVAYTRWKSCTALICSL